MKEFLKLESPTRRKRLECLIGRTTQDGSSILSTNSLLTPGTSGRLRIRRRLRMSTPRSTRTTMTTAGRRPQVQPGPLGSRQHPLKYLRSTVARPGHSDLSESFLVLNANLPRHVAMASMGEVKVSNLDEASLQQFQFYESTLDPSVSHARDRPLTPGPCRTTPRRSAFAHDHNR